MTAEGGWTEAPPKLNSGHWTVWPKCHVDINYTNLLIGIMAVPAAAAAAVAETHKKLMALRDVRKCELKKLEANLGRAPLKHICPQTALPYQECCGRKNRLLAKSNLRDKRLLATAA
jgi:hypothetical protein